MICVVQNQVKLLRMVSALMSVGNLMSHQYLSLGVLRRAVRYLHHQTRQVKEQEVIVLLNERVSKGPGFGVFFPGDYSAKYWRSKKLFDSLLPFYNLRKLSEVPDTSI